MFEEYKKYEPIFGSWYIKRLIGEGSFGKVFEIQRDDFGTYKAALKVVSIPKSTAEIEAARGEGMDETSLRTYYRSLVDEIVKEFALMSQLKGTANVVSYEDHLVVPHEDGIGWDVLIRMELLTSLKDYLSDHLMTERDIIKMGADICRALELCQKHNIIHRDIKPENIFISPNGDYKLGDFGIARTAESTMEGMSKKGTFFYMAPEVYRGYPYGSGVDIYSLGMVMYFFLNNKRHPFMPPSPQPIKFSDRESALGSLMKGKPIPRPVHGSDALWEVVKKACEYLPENRFPNPTVMKERLEALWLGDTTAESKIILGADSAAPMGKYMYGSGTSTAMPDGPGTAMLGLMGSYGDDAPTVAANTVNKKAAQQAARKQPVREPTQVRREPAPQPRQTRREPEKNSGTGGKIIAGSIFGAVLIIFLIFIAATVGAGRQNVTETPQEQTEVTDNTETDVTETEDGGEDEDADEGEDEQNEDEPLKATRLVLSTTVLNIQVGEHGVLSVSPSPNDAELGEITWYSSDADVATVDEDGNVTAVGAGIAGITAEADGLSATCTVNVTTPVTVTEINVTKPPAKTEYTVGETLSTEGLEITVRYTDGTTKVIADGFSISAAPFSQAGTYNITITYAERQASFTVTVTAEEEEQPEEQEPTEEPQE